MRLGKLGVLSTHKRRLRSFYQCCHCSYMRAATDELEITFIKHTAWEKIGLNVIRGFGFGVYWKQQHRTKVTIKRVLLLQAMPGMDFFLTI